MNFKVEVETVKGSKIAYIVSLDQLKDFLELLTECDSALRTIKVTGFKECNDNWR